MSSPQTLGTYEGVAKGTAFFAGHDAVRLAIRKLLAEREELLAQIRRWEDKEVHRASCCLDNEEKVAAALAMLREVEWSAADFANGAFRTVCPACRAAPHDGHAPGCRLAALLGRK